MGYSPLLRRALRFDWSGRWDGHQQALSSCGLSRTGVRLA